MLLTVNVSHSAPDVKVASELLELEQRVVDTVSKVKNSVIAIIIKDGDQISGSGSGVIVSKDGLIFTAAHVVEGQEKVTAIMADESEHTIEVLGMNFYKDVAVCRMADRSRLYPYSSPGSSDTLKVTDWVIAMGHGRGYDKTRTAPVRFGRVRAHNPGRYLTTNCTLIGGDSGGPLFNLQGEVVGINSSINGLAKFNVHAGVSGLLDDLERMKQGERWGILMPNAQYTPETPVLGVSFNDSSNFFNRSYSRPLIRGIKAQYPAEKAGLRAGDIIVKIADEEVSNSYEVAIALGRQKVGDKIEVIVQRDRNLLRTNALLEKAWIDVNNNPRNVAAPRLGESQDSPYVKKSDEAPLNEQQAQIFEWAKDLESKRGNSYVQLYSERDISNPLLHATIIKDGIALTPLSAFLNLPEDLLAWRPGIDAHPVQLLGSYIEHDLAVISIPGLALEIDLLSLDRKVKVGEFIGAMSNIGGTNGLTKVGVVSVEERNLKAFFGVAGANNTLGKGVLINVVVPGKPAYNMGIRKGDVVTRFNGVEVNSSKALVDEIEKLKVGEEIKVEYKRQGRAFMAETSLGGRSTDNGRIAQMDNLGRNSLSLNTSSFQTVIQSDILVEPEECGAPIFTLDGGFVGIAISDAGRNKSYLIPSHLIAESIETTPEPVERDAKQIAIRQSAGYEQYPDNHQEIEQLQRRTFEKLRKMNDNDPFKEMDDMFNEIFKDMFGK